MAKLIYSAITSLDLYVEDEHGDFGWAAPDADVHAFVNELERPIGTYLYGRRMYETMRFWDVPPTDGDEPAVSKEYAEIWGSADKIVFSRSLSRPTTARTRIEREYTADVVRRLKQQSAADLSIGGAELASLALDAGLVDEIHLLLMPIVVGAGKRALPDRLRFRLTLLDERRFAAGAVHLAYAVHNDDDR